ncbi:MAG TPA: hypothetical protein VFV37_05200 [Luteibaculaceae bacterium]|nr:hypothetical protein [Luteibaculaceae bacterium]
MYTALKHFHSPFRYIVLMFLIYAVITALLGMSRKSEFTPAHNRVSLFAMIFCHVQLLVGILLFTVSPIIEVGLSDMGSAMQDPQVRFYLIEHPLLMIAAIALITVGRSTSKKAVDSAAKFKKIAIFYGIGLVLILVSIPWPFLKDFGTWH